MNVRVAGRRGVNAEVARVFGFHPASEGHPASSLRCGDRTPRDHSHAPTPEPLECRLRLIRHPLARHSLYLYSHLIALVPSHHFAAHAFSSFTLTFSSLVCSFPPTSPPPRPAFQLPAWADP